MYSNKSCMNGVLLSKIEFPWAQALWCHQGRPDNEGDLWLTRGKHGRSGETRQRDDSVPGGTEWDSHEQSTISKGWLSISAIFHLVFSDYGLPWVTETMGSETVDKGGE